MKKTIKRVVSSVVILSMVTSISATTFADEISVNKEQLNSVLDYDTTEIDEQNVQDVYFEDVTDDVSTIMEEQSEEEQIENAVEAVEELTPEAQVLFEQSLASDPEMLEFHTTYIDENFVPPNKKQVRGAVTDPLVTLMSKLNTLGLPTAVLYSLRAVGASIVASVADGVFPFGEAALAVSTVTAAATIAANWNAVAPVWPSVVSAFKTTFSKYSTTIGSAFDSLYSKIQKELIARPCVTVSGKVLTVNGVRYNCTTKAD